MNVNDAVREERMDHRPPVINVTDGLGHDLPASSGWLSEQMLGWLDLEAGCGDLSPGLSELRDWLREDVESDV